MAIFKCKMCGGDIPAEEGKTLGTCTHCGTTTTLPKANDEKLVNLFNRANHFRRQNEFDKAIAAYESILSEDGTNAEAHWGVVLCRYGIEYVKDPRTQERVPTCRRAQFEPILSDADYLAALENAPDSYTRDQYEAEAQKISEIQKRILAISSKEEPFDVFICYKETTDGGSRTKDSLTAQEIYQQLTKENYKVFFSKITLEDKVGKQYEPYIFSALNSAKVMLVVGSKKEYFNAVWVKNEWSRYYALTKKDPSRLLIPCYKDIDPYEDLPSELSALQGYDMSKVGFMHDLLHLVKKVLDRASPAGTKQASSAGAPVAPGVESLMKRGWLFLEDSDWEQAGEYFDKVLDIDPEHAPAYVGKLCARLEVNKEADLAQQKQPFDEDTDYKKALRFADAALKAKLGGFIHNIISEIKYQSLIQAKLAATTELIQAKQLTAATEYACESLARQFREMRDYKDTAKLAKECENIVKEWENIVKESKYQELIQGKKNASTEYAYTSLAKHFREMGDYKDSAELAKECENQRIAEQERLERERIVKQERLEQERKAREEQERKEREEIESKNDKEERSLFLQTIIGAAWAIGVIILGVHFSRPEFDNPPLFWIVALALPPSILMGLIERKLPRGGSDDNFIQIIFSLMAAVLGITIALVWDNMVFFFLFGFLFVVISMGIHIFLADKHKTWKAQGLCFWCGGKLVYNRCQTPKCSYHNKVQPK